MFKLKKRYFLFIVFIVLPFTASAMRISSTKIAYVNMTRVFEEIDQIKDARNKLRETLEERKDKIAELEQGIASVRNKLGENKDNLPPDEIKAFEEMIEKKQEELRDIMEEGKKFVTDKEAEFKNKIMGDIYDAVNKIAASEKITVILDKESVIYTENSVVDITDKVIKYLNGEN